jgi:hypothetical protein
MTSRPTWSDYATHDESAYPHLWSGCVFAAAPCLGPTGSQLFDVVGGRRGTMTNMDPPTDWIVKSGTYAVSFDGTDDYISFGSINPGLTNATVSIWVFNRTTATNKRFIDNAYNTGFWIGTDSLADASKFIGGFVCDAAPYGSSGVGLANAWNHIAIRRIGSTSLIFVNGSSAGSTAYTNVATATSSGLLTLGIANNLTNQQCDCDLDDARIYNRALSDAEIRELAQYRGVAYGRRVRVYRGYTFSDNSVTGTAAPTQASQTSTASGSVVFTGTATPTQSSQTSTASGKVNTLAGYLNKTPYSYLTREDADFAGLDYSASDFSVEIAVDIPSGGFIGSYSELMRHGDYQNAYYTARSGWTLHASTYGYGDYAGWKISASVMGGTQQAQCIDTSFRTGKNHVLITFVRSTGVLKLYVNGSQVATATNASVAMPSSVGGTLTIGGVNKERTNDTPSVNGAAMPEFGFYYARLWNDDLTSSDVSAIYSHWSGTGKVTIPSGPTASVVSGWYCSNQVSDKNGAAGTGWLKDMAGGGNHLKIVDTGAITGGEQPTLVSPSGSVQITSPTDGATGVSGAATIQAGGIMGTGAAMQYYIEVDESSAFNTGNLRNSGWLLADGKWKPGFKPGQTYYARCKARQIEDSSSESSWSSTVTFATRAVTTFYVRPKTTAGTYGTEIGTSYTNAWNGFRHNGNTDGLAANLLKAQCDIRNLAPGDEVYACGNFGLITSGTMSVPSTNPYRELLNGTGLAGCPITVRMDHGTYPGAIYHFFKYTGAYSWSSVGGGVYSTTTYLSTYYLAIDNGSGVPDMGSDGIAQSLLLYDNSNTLASPGFYVSAGTMYVKMPDGNSPENKLWYLYGTAETYGLVATNAASYITLQGGSWYGTSPMPELRLDAASNITVSDALFKYSNTEACIMVADYQDNWTVENCEFSWCQNAIYGWNYPFGGSGLTGDNWTITNNFFHHIGEGGWLHDDAHCVGWQAGNGWNVTDNLCWRSGSAITQWGSSSSKTSIDNKIRRNVIISSYNKNITFGCGISFENGASILGDRTGNEITDNIIVNTDGPGIHYSAPDAVGIVGNLIINSGVNSAVDSDVRNGINLSNVSGSQAARATITNNVVVGPDQKYIRVGGNGTLTYLDIDDNVFYTRGQSSSTASKFECEGYLSGSPQSFTAWVAGGTFDQSSVWQDPLTASLPASFDDMYVDFMFGNMVGDIDDDTDVDATDATTLAADAGAPRLALERFLDEILNDHIWTSGLSVLTQGSQTSTASGTVTNPGFTGTVAVTQASQTGSASGLETFTGTSTPTQASSTSTASGSLVFTGTAARTQADQTSTATASLVFTGISAKTQDDHTSTASGSLAGAITGTSATTQDSQISQASGALPNMFKQFTANRLSPTFTADRSLT